MELLKNCPACESESLKPLFIAKDYFLTEEEFSVVQCDKCKLRFTNPRPGFNEIMKYYDSSEYISHDTSYKSILTIIYTVARNFMLKRKYSIVRKYSKGENILDVGCGSGEFLNYCKSKGSNTFGVELNDKPREFARKSYGLEIREKLSDFPETEFAFDCITLWHVLEHIHDLNETMNLLQQRLNPGGLLVIALPNFASWDAEHFHRFWAAYDLPRHLYHFNADVFKNFASKHNYKILKILPQKLDSFYISLISEKYMHGKSNLLKAFILGAYSNLAARKEGRGHSSLIYILSKDSA